MCSGNKKKKLIVIKAVCFDYEMITKGHQESDPRPDQPTESLRYGSFYDAEATQLTSRLPHDNCITTASVG